MSNLIENRMSAVCAFLAGKCPWRFKHQNSSRVSKGSWIV
jgi:hypothetical protein